MTPTSSPPLDPQSLAWRLMAALASEQGAAVTVKELSGGRYLLADGAVDRIFGRPAVEIVGRHDAELFDGGIAAMLRAAEQATLARAAPLWSEHRFDATARLREFDVLRACDGQYLGAVWIDRAGARQREQQLRSALEQLEQQQRANAELRREIADQALRDPASGLYSWAHFQEQLRREVDLSTREHREFALVLIELDPPGDAVRAAGPAGHAQLLEAVGRLLRSGTRAMDTSCRVDDGRFAVLLSGVGLATAHSRMEGLRRRCAAQIVVLDGQELGFTVSMGVASFPHTAQTLESLMKASDNALSEARRRGGNLLTLASIPLVPD